MSVVGEDVEVQMSRTASEKSASLEPGAAGVDRPALMGTADAYGPLLFTERRQ